jgi:hypothetical protein
MERVVLAHGGAAGDDISCVNGSVTIRSAVVVGSAQALTNGAWNIDECLIQGFFVGTFHAKNSVWLGARYDTTQVHQLRLENVVLVGSWQLGPQSVMRSCTLTGPLKLSGGAPKEIVDCVFASVESDNAGHVIEFCNVHGNPPFIDQAKPGKGCFRADPQFVDPGNLDYRLRPTSPCRGRASDGGDIGCRYTPEMIELCKQALELRRRGIINF